MKKLILNILTFVSIFIFLYLGSVYPKALKDDFLNKNEIKSYVKTELSKYKKDIVFCTTDKNIKNWLKEDVLSYKNLGEKNYYNYNGCKISYLNYSKYVKVDLKVSYKLTKKQMNYVNNKVNNVSKICKRKTTIDTVKQVNKYWKNNLSYVDSQDSIYKGLKNKIGNCYTYSMLTYLTLDKLNIRNNTVYGTINGNPHIWNKVKIDNQWKYLDVTYNDGLNDKYLLLTKKQISKTHKEISRN